MNPFILIGVALIAFGAYQEMNKKRATSNVEPPKPKEETPKPAVNPTEPIIKP